MQGIGPKVIGDIENSRPIAYVAWFDLSSLVLPVSITQEMKLLF